MNIYRYVNPLYSSMNIMSMILYRKKMGPIFFYFPVNIQLVLNIIGPA